MRRMAGTLASRTPDKAPCEAVWKPGMRLAVFGAPPPALDILQFKLDILWSMLDVIQHAHP